MHRFKFVRGADSPETGRPTLTVTTEADLDDIQLDGGAGTTTEDAPAGERTRDTEAEDEGTDEGLDDKARARVQRYKEKAQDRDQIAEERNNLLREVRDLRAADEARAKALEVANATTPEQLAEQLGEQIFSEVSKITDEDADVRTKKVYGVLARMIVKLQQQGVATAVKAVEIKQEKATQQDRARSAAEADAMENAKIALEEVGLDPEKTYPMFEQLVKNIIDEKPKWFQVVPPDQQYMRIAERVLKTVKDTKDDNEAQRREASGILAPGTKRRPAPKGDDGSKAPDTIASGLRVLSERARQKGTALYNIARTNGS